MTNPLQLTVVIPVYKSAELLEDLTSQLIGCLDNSGIKFEVILVCDASPDASWQLIKKISNNESRIKGVLLRKNVGQHNAIIVGMKYASGDYVITMDDDLQHSPRDVPRLLDEIQLGFDVVYCIFEKRKHKVWKVAGSQLTNWVMTKFGGKPRNIYLSPYRILNRDICFEIVKAQTPNSYIDGIILKITGNIGSILVPHYDRKLGNSNYDLKRSISLWLKMLTSNTTFPLRMVSLLGALLSSLSLFLIVFLIIGRLTDQITSTGWSSLMVAIIFLGGIQLLSLGILGEYLGRVFSFTSLQPIASIRETLGMKENLRNSDSE